MNNAFTQKDRNSFKAKRHIRISEIIAHVKGIVKGQRLCDNVRSNKGKQMAAKEASIEASIATYTDTHERD